MGYHHLSVHEREVIMIELKQGSTLSQIAVQLGRAVSTISREIRRNGGVRVYRAHQAERLAQAARHKPRRRNKMADQKLRAYVDKKLRCYWSPEQIAGRLGYEKRPDSMRVCHETIYRFILSAARDGVDYGPYLRQGHRRHTYGWRGNKRFKRIRNFKTIDQRPTIIDQRQRIGDWESDTVRGPQRGQAGIATHVERQTRYLVACKLGARTASAYNEATIEAFKNTPLPVHTMTVDNGMEFSQFSELEEALGTEVYFAHPYHSWERGLNENTNGLLRQYFPRGRDLTGVHPREIQQAVLALNQRPRKCLGYRTPTESLKLNLVALGD